MRYLTPKQILGFLQANFEFIETLYKLRGQDDSISLEDFQKVASENNLDEDKILKYKILKPISNGDLIFDAHYKKFIEFLLEQTSLTLRESWANQTKVISDAFANLQVTREKQDIVFYIRGLRNTIDEFITDIKTELDQLLKDTEALKAGERNADDLTERILKARNWINSFVKPLNDILDHNQTQSIINVIYRLMRYANDKKIEEEDYELTKLYEQLYFFIDNANKELNRIIRDLVKELLPLLREIERDSLILQGFIHFLESPFKLDELPVELPNFPTRKKHFIYTSAFAEQAELYVDQFKDKKPVFFSNEVPEIDDWTPDTTYYKELLLKQVPVNNFYQWCYDQLKEEVETIDTIKFISLAYLIHLEEFNAEFQPNQSFTLNLQDAYLTLPKVKVYASIS
jgi:hypothetical protein